MSSKLFGPNKDVVLDVCPKCSGVWLDEGELNQLDECTWSDIEKETDFTSVKGADREVCCPKCAVALETKTPGDYPSIEVDQCPACRGFWLDSGEMTKWLVNRVL